VSGERQVQTHLDLGQCFIAGDAGHGDACRANTDCAPSHECAEGMCRQYCCEEGETDGCPDGTRCSTEKQTAAREATGVFLCSRPDDSDLQQ